MIRFFSSSLLALTATALCACGPRSPTQTPTPPPVPAADAASERLTRLVERYWDDTAAKAPWYNWSGAPLSFTATSGGEISPQSLADTLATEQRYLRELASVPPGSLDREAQLNYEMFRRGRLEAIEALTYPFELMPVNPQQSMPQQYARMACADERAALADPKEFARWSVRADAFVAWTQQAIANMRDGARRGYTLPRPLVQQMLPQLVVLGDDAPGNPFLVAIPADTGATERSGRDADMRAIIKERIAPAYRRLHDFLKTEYIPRARTSLSLSALPLGPAWYAFLARRATGGSLTAAQLHALGMTELEKLRQRSQALLAESAVGGDLTAYFAQMRRDPRFAHHSAADLEGAYEALKAQVAAAAAPLFDAGPRADFVLRSEDFLGAAAPSLAYAPGSPNGVIPAALYVDTRHLDDRPVIDMPAQYLREAVPGRHYQVGLQRERLDLPRFRRYGMQRAFGEGWALYAATLGDELGLYRDPESKWGAWLAQAVCAAGLVLDTGIHAEGWSAQAALDFLHAQLPLDEIAAGRMVDLIVALPGEALACTVGYLKFQALRAQAQQKLGARFELRAFHAAAIRDGAMPFDLLEPRMRRWIEETAASPPPPPAGSAAAPVAADAGAAGAAATGVASGAHP